MADDRFGEIKIDGVPPKESKDSDVFLSQSSDPGEGVLSNEIGNSTLDSESKSSGHRQLHAHKYSLPMPSGKTVAWLSLIPLLVILYGVGSYFLVPIVIKDLLAPKLSQHVDRPVDIGRIVFSPFKLELFIDDVTVGSMRGDKTGRNLFLLENSRFQFSLGRIFDGKILCREADFDGILLNVVRHQDVKIDLEKISDLFFSHSAGEKIKYWPTWLFLNEVKVNDGQVVVDDRMTQKVFTIEQIQFYLPSAVTRDLDKEVLPKLKAVIDSSPFEINAVRFRDQSGTLRTGFSFEFKKLIMDNFKELFPMPETGLLLSEGEADISLDIILPEKHHGSEGIIVEGEANLRSVRWHDPDAQTVLLLPEARIVYHLVPGEKIIRFTSVEFHEPELSVAGKRDAAAVGAFASLEYLQSVLKRVSQSKKNLQVENFIWNNGSIIMASRNAAGNKSKWNDVNFSMQGLATVGYRALHPSIIDQAQYTLRAKDLSTKPFTDFISEGQISTNAIMKGKLEITGLDMARYSTLLPKSDFVMQKGKADILMHYEYGGRLATDQENASILNKIYNSTFKTIGYAFAIKGKKAVTGEMMTCSRLHFEMLSRKVVCDQLEVFKSKIFSDILFGEQTTNQKNGPDNWQFVVNNLQVRDSTIHTSMKGVSSAKKKTSLVIQDVTMESKNLQSEKVADNVKATGRIGKKGNLSVSGHYSMQTGRGDLRLKIEELELSLLQPYFSSWFVPKLKKGKFGATGILQLPEREFRGKVHVDDLDADEVSGAGVNWKQAFCEKCTYRSAPMALQMDELVIYQPFVKPGLSSGDRPIHNYLRLKDESLPLSVRIGSIRVEDGSFGLPEPIIYPGFQPLLHDIYGTLTPVDQFNHRFSIKGKIEGQGRFSLQGKGTMTGLLSYQADVQDFSLIPFDSILKKDAGFSSQQQQSASWTQEMIFENNHSKVATIIALQGVVPDPATPIAQVLPLIINEKNRFEIKMDGQYTDDRPQPFLLEQLVNKLRHLGVKSDISPYLVLKETLPELDLAQRVAFAPGSVQLLEPVPLLSGYLELLKIRPFIKLGLQGQFDPVSDRDVLLAELQKEADRQWDIENKQRAMEKIKKQQQEKSRLKELKAGGPTVVAEEILPDELTTTDLQPIPRIKVQLDISKLKELARQRAQVLQNHLVSKLQVDPARITIKAGAAKKTASVEIELLPTFSVEIKKK